MWIIKTTKLFKMNFKKLGPQVENNFPKKPVVKHIII